MEFSLALPMEFIIALRYGSYRCLRFSFYCWEESWFSQNFPKRIYFTL